MSRIVRAEHARDYTCIANDALRDERLGWAARGLLAYVLSRPDDWTVMLSELVGASPDGRARVERALDELGRYGYIERRVDRGPDGRPVVSSTVWESPRCRFPAVGNPPREIRIYEVLNNKSSMSENGSGKAAQRGLWPAAVPDVDGPVEEASPESEPSPMPAWLRDGGVSAAMQSVRTPSDDDGARVPDAGATGSEAERGLGGTDAAAGAGGGT